MELSKPLSDLPLIMVDNGWELSGACDFALLERGGIALSKSLAITHDILRKDLKYLLSVHSEDQWLEEHKIYDAVYGQALRYDITRYDFHLFLRQCTENEYLLQYVYSASSNLCL